MNSIWGGSKIKFNTSRGGSGKNVLMQTKKSPPPPHINNDWSLRE
jgi:hypothetical protein